MSYFGQGRSHLHILIKNWMILGRTFPSKDNVEVFEVKINSFGPKLPDFINNLTFFRKVKVV